MIFLAIVVAFLTMGDPGCSSLLQQGLIETHNCDMRTTAEIVRTERPTSKRFIDLTGNIYHKLTVVEWFGLIKGSSYWLCDCDCGKKNHLVSSSNLKGGQVKSCGCFYRTNPETMPKPPFGVRYIPLTMGAFAIVDEDLYGDVSLRIWHKACGRYAGSYDDAGKHILMHRFLMGFPSGMEIDHINGNGLDNRMSNLRLATKSQNKWNGKKRNPKSGFKGVYAKMDKWQAKIVKFRKQITLGVFETPEEAHAAYCDAAKRLHGEFARFE